MQVTWPRFHRPRFRSSGESTFFRVLCALTALAWISTLWPEDMGPEGPLTDATVIEHRQSDQRAILSISHPTEDWVCEIPRTDFPDDWPAIGVVMPIVNHDAGCGLPRPEPAPSTAMVATAILGTVIAAGWSLYVVTRPPLPRPAPVPAAATSSKGKERRRRRKRRLSR